MIRLHETGDGWVIEVTGEHEVAVVPKEPGVKPKDDLRERWEAISRQAQEILSKPVAESLDHRYCAGETLRAVAKERARVERWLNRYESDNYSTTWIEAKTAIRDGREVPK